MASRIRPPEEMRLPLTGDDWLLVKKHLTWGEQRDSETFMVKVMKAGTGIELDHSKLGVGLLVVYLLDWSLPIPIRGLGPEGIHTALRNLDPELGNEIILAVIAHDNAMRELREAEKKTPTGTTVSPTT